MLRANWMLILLAVTGGIGALLVNLLWMEMIDAVHGTLAENNKLSYYSSTPWGIGRRYAKVNPDSMRPKLVSIFMCISGLCFVGIIVIQLSRR
jgi:hypothetical protein